MEYDLPENGPGDWTGSGFGLTDYGRHQVKLTQRGNLHLGTGTPYRQAATEALPGWVDRAVLSGGTGVAKVTLTYDFAGIFTDSNYASNKDQTFVGIYPEVRLGQDFAGHSIFINKVGAFQSSFVTYDFSVPYGEEVGFESFVQFALRHTVTEAVPVTTFDSSLEISKAALRLTVYNTDGTINYGARLTGASGTVYLVPEPASLAVLGLGGLVALRRRRSA